MLTQDVALIQEKNEVHSSQDFIRADCLPQEDAIFLYMIYDFSIIRGWWNELRTSRLACLSSASVWSNALMGARNRIALMSSKNGTQAASKAMSVDAMWTVDNVYLAISKVIHCYSQENVDETYLWSRPTNIIDHPPRCTVFTHRCFHIECILWYSNRLQPRLEYIIYQIGGSNRCLMRDVR